MQVEITDTPNSQLVDGSSASKIYLMDEIIKIFTPLFSEEIDRKKQQVESNKNVKEIERS